jgi:hypothetical protein
MDALTDTFRNQLSELVAMMTTAKVLKETWPPQTAWQDVLARDPSLRSLVERVSVAATQVGLMIKDDEPMHQEFMQAVRGAGELMLDSAHREPEMTQQLDRGTELGRRIIRYEWGRVKRGI